MSRTKTTSKVKRGTKAVPVLGAAGLLSLAGGATAATAPTTEVATPNTLPNHQITLGEEEISDVSLSTFYVFDKESAAQPLAGMKVAQRCGRCGGCRGCRCGGGCGWAACWGCGCGPCCASVGRCRWC